MWCLFVVWDQEAGQALHNCRSCNHNTKEEKWISCILQSGHVHCPLKWLADMCYIHLAFWIFFPEKCQRQRDVPHTDCTRLRIELGKWKARLVNTAICRSAGQNNDNNCFCLTIPSVICPLLSKPKFLPNFSAEYFQTVGSWGGTAHVSNFN